MGRVTRLEIEVLSSKAALRELAGTWRRAKAGKTSTPKLAFGSLRGLFSAITEKRLELVRFVAAHEGLNTRQLAQQLGRDYKNVHSDVAELVELGLLDKGDRGGLTAPFDEIVIHAVVRDAA
jgi:predicted transcriptional regulator